MVFGIVAAGLILPAQIGLLGAVYALAAKFAFATAHLAVMRLRFVEPDLYRPYEMPFNIPYGRASIPVLSIVGALAIGTVFTQLVFQNISSSTWIFLVWLVLGAAGFVWYRRRRKEPWWEPLEVPPPPDREVARGPIEPHPTAARYRHGRREKVLAHAAPIPARRRRRPPPPPRAPPLLPPPRPLPRAPQPAGFALLTVAARRRPPPPWF